MKCPNPKCKKETDPDGMCCGSNKVTYQYYCNSCGASWNEVI
jgi:hypothetical protein